MTRPATLPPPDAGSVWTRKGRMRRVIAALNGRVCYSTGGNKNRWCAARTWRIWANKAECVGEAIDNLMENGNG